MTLKGKKIGILAENLYQDQELWYPYFRMKEEGAEVLIIGSGSSDTYNSKYGFPVTCDTAADRISPQELSCLIIPGGYAPDNMRRYPSMVKLVRDCFQQGKVVAAICHGGWMLASAGCIKNKTLTSFFAIRDDMVNAGAEWVDREVVVDGNLITSRMPDDLPAFCREIISLLYKQS